MFKWHGDGVHPPPGMIFKDTPATWSMRVGGSFVKGEEWVVVLVELVVVEVVEPIITCLTYLLMSIVQSCP